MFSIGFILFFVQSFYFIEYSYGHGYLTDPPARSTAWRYDTDFAKCCKYYDDNQMFCGGSQVQWTRNGGKCTICGEAYDAKPTLFGLGDKLYLGKIVRTYTQGSVMPVTVELTANHMGAFEFRICSIDADPTKDATQNCLDLNILSLADGETQYKIESSYRIINVNITLPAELVCKHCVFQWKYITGNSWGTAVNGRQCLGCGNVNEQFYGCADIAIVPSVKRKRNIFAKNGIIKHQ